jgi:hypothetical protein
LTGGAGADNVACLSRHNGSRMIRFARTEALTGGDYRFAAVEELQ